MKMSFVPVICFAVPVLFCSMIASAAADPIALRAEKIPSDFPGYTIPGHTSETAVLRDISWHHEDARRPKATLWDEWLLSPSLWPAHNHAEATAAWRRTLLARHIDPDGYVATHQHQSISHQRGWPFPGWHQGPGGFGWHFSFDKTIGPPWRPDGIASTDDWATTGVESAGIEKTGWALSLIAPGSSIAPPAINNSAHNSPFLQLRWNAENLPVTAAPYVEWTTTDQPAFSPDRRMHFAPPSDDKIIYSMIPLYRHPAWREKQITGLRLNFDNQTTGARVVVQALFSQYDTRHDVNNPAYVSACVDYFHWTRDLNFLRENIERMRLAMRFMESEFGTEEDGIVKLPWVGHEGTSGLEPGKDGKMVMRSGFGVGNNYWDLMPFGQQDSYATIRHYGAARRMAQLENEIARHPGWNIPPSPLARSAEHWNAQADMTRENGNRLFWNSTTGRFTVGIDSEGKQADYGFTFLNLEAIAYDFATPEHARAIMDWIEGRRIVESDTSRGADIYTWKFAPRATTLRNIDHYGWFWPDAASIAFGDQVQDGGAVFGFSYHDLMARLKTNGPDDAAKRLSEICDWYMDVAREGGYRAYYDGKKRPGTLQGGGTAGGLGLDKEFFESVMVPEVLIDGFLGLEPTGVGMNIQPKLPSDWTSLTIDHIMVHDVEFTATATVDSLKLAPTNAPAGRPTLRVGVPTGWTVKSGTARRGDASERDEASDLNYYDWNTASSIEFERGDAGVR